MNTKLIYDTMLIGTKTVKDIYYVIGDSLLN